MRASQAKQTSSVTNPDRTRKRLESVTGRGQLSGCVACPSDALLTMMKSFPDTMLRTLGAMAAAACLLTACSDHQEAPQAEAAEPTEEEIPLSDPLQPVSEATGSRSQPGADRESSSETAGKSEAPAADVNSGADMIPIVESGISADAEPVFADGETVSLQELLIYRNKLIHQVPNRIPGIANSEPILTLEETRRSFRERIHGQPVRLTLEGVCKELVQADGVLELKATDLRVLLEDSTIETRTATHGGYHQRLVSGMPVIFMFDHGLRFSSKDYGAIAAAMTSGTRFRCRAYMTPVINMEFPKFPLELPSPESAPLNADSLVIER